MGELLPVRIWRNSTVERMSTREEKFRLQSTSNNRIWVRLVDRRRGQADCRSGQVYRRRPDTDIQIARFS
jgi:hypothetical protein